jgi:hypothetical protein
MGQQSQLALTMMNRAVPALSRDPLETAQEDVQAQRLSREALEQNRGEFQPLMR